MANFTVSTSAQLTTALQQASGGDTISLASGNYGDFSFSGKTFSSDVKIVSQDAGNPAVFNTMSFNNVDHLAIDKVFVDFKPNAATLDNAAGLSVRDSAHITISNSVFEGGVSPNDGLMIGRGIYVLDSQDVTITNNDVSHFRRGILTSDTDQIKITYNHVHENRTTTLSGGNVSNALIEGNHLESSSPNNFGGTGDHGDFIHYWTRNIQTGPSENFIIRGNFIEQGTGTGILGIYMDNDTNPQGFKNVLIENNVIHNSNGQGVRLEDVDGGIVRNNTLLQSEGDYRDAPRIRVEDGSKNILIENNIVSNTTAGGALDNISGNHIVEHGTVVVQNTNPSAPNYVGNLFVNLPLANGDLADLQPRPGAFPGNVGAYLTPNMIAADHSGTGGGGSNSGGGTGGGAGGGTGGGSNSGGGTGGGAGGGTGGGTGGTTGGDHHVLDDYVLDFVTLIGTRQLRGNAAVVSTQDDAVLRLDGDRDYAKLGRLAQFEKTQQLSVSVDYERDIADGRDANLAWNHKKLGVTVTGDGLMISVGTADGKFTKISVGDLGLNDTDKHNITVLLDAQADRLQVLVDNKLVLDNDDYDFQLIGAGGREAGWSLGTKWGNYHDGDISGFSIEAGVHFVDGHVVDHVVG